MSAPETLRAICVRKLCDLLMSGAWDKCKDNPFAYMPISIVEDLLSAMWPEGSNVSRESISHSRLLVTSGRIEQFKLPSAESDGAFVEVLRMLSRGCQNLRKLTLLREDKNPSLLFLQEEIRNIDTEHQVLQELLQNCSKLEYLHSSIYFEPNALWNCINLKTLRLHFSLEVAVTFSRCVTSDLLKRLASIEKYALCHLSGPSALIPFLRHEVVSILDKCPQLTSLGSIDSLKILKDLHDRDLKTLGTPRRLQLRKCYWDRDSLDFSQSRYCDMVKAAASSCPLMEVLIIPVRYPGSLKYLKTFRSLTFLDITFFRYKTNYEHEFYSLLEEIGSQLQCLSVSDRIPLKPLSLNAICGNCPKLNKLRLFCQVTVDEGVKPSVNLLKLEHLNVFHIDQKSSIFLLSNCPHLKMLCLEFRQKLEDSTFQAILRKNPFSQLEVALLRKTSFSKSGLVMLAQSALNLSKCCLDSDLMGDDEVMRCMKDVNPRVVCLPSAYFYVHRYEQFSPNLLSSCML